MVLHRSVLPPTKIPRKQVWVAAAAEVAEPAANDPAAAAAVMLAFLALLAPCWLGP